MGAGTSFFYYNKPMKDGAEKQMGAPRRVHLRTYGWPLNATKMTNRRLCHLFIKGFTLFNFFGITSVRALPQR